jgi:WD40 repeat protein
MAAEKSPLVKTPALFLALMCTAGYACLILEFPGSGTAVQPSNTPRTATVEAAAPTATVEPSPEPLWPYPPIDPSNAGGVKPVGRFGRGRLLDLDWSADGERLILSTSAGLDIYDAGTLTLAGSLPTPAEAGVLAVSPSGDRAAAGLSDGRVQLWDTSAGGGPQPAREWTASATALAFSPDGALLAAGSADDDVWVWETDGGGLRAAMKGDTGRVTALAFSPDGSLLAVSFRREASGPVYATIAWWDLQTGEPAGLLRDFGQPADALYFSADGKTLFIIGWEGDVLAVQAESGERRTLYSGNGCRAVMPLDLDRRIFAVRCADGVWLWDVAADEAVRRVAEIEGYTQGMAFSGDGGRLAVGFTAGSVEVWNTATGSRAGSMDEHHGTILCMALSPDGLSAAVGYGYETFRISLWDSAAGTELLLLPGHAQDVQSVAFSPDGTLLASGSSDGLAVVWDPASGEKLLSLDGDTGLISGVAFTPDGRSLLSSSWGADVILWNLSDGKGKVLFSMPGSYIYALAASPEGGMVAAGGGYGRKAVRLAGLPGGETLYEFEDADSYRLAFSPDGRLLSSGRMVWDTATGEAVLDLNLKRFSATAVAFSPDGAVLAVGQADGRVVLFDAADGGLLASLTGHNGRVSDVAFTPDGRVLFSSSVDGTVRLWAAAY